MISYVIVCRTFSYADRAVRILDNSGIPVIMILLPDSVSHNGYTVGLKVDRNILSTVLNALNTKELCPVRVMLLDRNLQFKEAAL